MHEEYGNCSPVPRPVPTKASVTTPPTTPKITTTAHPVTTPNITTPNITTTAQISTQMDRPRNNEPMFQAQSKKVIYLRILLNLLETVVSKGSNDHLINL